MDIDDDDESEVVYMPNKKAVSDRNAFEHQIIIEIKDTRMRIAQSP